MRLTLAFILLFMLAFPAGADYSPLPSRRPPIRTEAHLAKGRFLVASPSMNDPRFSGTIILLLDYGEHGAIGVVINRPTRIRLSQAFANVKGFEKRDGTLFLGGPVDTKHVFVLLRSETVEPQAMRVFRDVFVSESEAALEDASTGKFDYRVFAGYAGWAPHQLDREVFEGVWEVTDGDVDAILSGKAP